MLCVGVEKGKVQQEVMWTVKRMSELRLATRYRYELQ
jgi:hypothetical protein